MKTNEMTQEEISAFADSELPQRRIDAITIALQQAEQQECWDLYHQIGDVMRSDDMAIGFSPEFKTRMAARLELEPAWIAPAAGAMSTPTLCSRSEPLSRKHIFSHRRLIVPGLAAAAAVVYFSIPQLMVASGNPDNRNGFTQMADQTGHGMPRLAGWFGKSGVGATSATSATTASPVAAKEIVVLRDPLIDEYLLAHQRYSPSLYSTAQFARSATFASDSDK